MPVIKFLKNGKTKKSRPFFLYSSSGTDQDPEPEPITPWYWKLNGSSYAQFDGEVVLSGDFSHEFTAAFPSTSFHLLSDNRTGSAARFFISSSSLRLVGLGNISLVQLSANEFNLLTNGLAHTFKYGRIGSVWYVQIDGIMAGIPAADGDLTASATCNNFGDLYGSTTGIPRFTGYHWNHTIITSARTMVIPFNEAFNSSDHTFKNSAGTVIGTKYNDLAVDYTETKPL